MPSGPGSQPGRQVIALSGDGGIAMLLGELITLRQQHLPVKVVVFSNGALSFVGLEMKAVGIVTYGTDLDNPDFAGIAGPPGCSAPGSRRSASWRTRCGPRSPTTAQPSRTSAQPGMAVAAAQTRLRRDQGLHPVRHHDHPVRRRRGTHREVTNQSAGT